MDWTQIQAIVAAIPPEPDKQARLRQYAAVLNDIAPPPELSDKTARLLIDRLRI